MPTSYKTHIADGAAIWLEIRELDGSIGRIDLDPVSASLLARRGHGVGTGPDDGVEFGDVCVDGDVRFFADGRRISTAAGLTAIAGGVITLAVEAARYVTDGQELPS